MINLELIPVSGKSGIIYSIRNITTGREYIGGTRKNRYRIQHHLARLREGTHHNKKLQADFDLYGEADFEVQVLEFVTGEINCTRRQVIKRETEFLQTLRPYYNEKLLAN